MDSAATPEATKTSAATKKQSYEANHKSPVNSDDKSLEGTGDKSFAAPGTPAGDAEWNLLVAIITGKHKALGIL